LTIDSQTYDIIKSVSLSNAYSYTYQKSDYFTPSGYNDDTVSANRKVAYKEDPDVDNENYKKETINQIRPGVLRLVKNMETRKKSDLFVIVVAGLVNDIKDQFLLNYYTARIFYNNMNLAAFSAEMKILKIKDDTIKKMWYDETYGFGKLSSFNVYMRMLILGKTRIKTYLKNYFDISEY
jgi:hypothetical protein